MRKVKQKSARAIGLLFPQPWSLLLWLLSSINPCSTFHCSFVSNSLSVWRKLSLSSKFSLLPITFALFADCLEKQGFCIHQFFQLSFVLKSSLCRGCWDILAHCTCKHKRLLAFALKDLTLVRLISSFAVKSLEIEQSNDTQILHNSNANTTWHSPLWMDHRIYLLQLPFLELSWRFCVQFLITLITFKN